MISIEEALSTVKKQVVKTTSKKVTLIDALGSYLTQSIHAPIDLPQFDNSAMDGYAVCGVHTSYEIIGEVAAGHSTDTKLEEGKAVRIFTGAPVPPNSTAVIMQEKCEVNGTTLTISDEVTEGKNVRGKGNEIAKDQVVFEEGYQITPAALGMLGSLGISEVEVGVKPTIRLVTTGDELIQPGQTLEPGQIYESNSTALAGALRKHGFEVAEQLQFKDGYEAIKSGIAEALERTDVLLISGGISVGEYDFVKRALEENGVEELFYKVYQKPGKPLFFGRKGNQFVFALPGNPASSLTCLFIYVLPLLQKISGASQLGLQRVRLPLAESYDFKSDRPAFLKARIYNSQVQILDGQGSSMIHSMALGNALVFLDGARRYEAGEGVECVMI